jgi:hypothetical protein
MKEESKRRCKEGLGASRLQGPESAKPIYILHGCETWSLTLREERRLRVFENSVLRIFGPKREEVTGEWIELHNEELKYLYTSPNILRVIKSRRMRRAGHVMQRGGERRVYSFGGELLGKETTGGTQA